MHLFFVLLTVAVTSYFKLPPPLPIKDCNLKLRTKITLLSLLVLLREHFMVARNKAKTASETEVSMSCELTYLVSVRQQTPHSFPSLWSHRDESGIVSYQPPHIPGTHTLLAQCQ